MGIFFVAEQESRYDADSRLRKLEQIINEDADALRSRIHARLPNRARSVADTEDVLSTVSRRVVNAISAGMLRASERREIAAYLHRVLEEAVREKSRRGGRLQSREAIAAERAAEFKNESEECPSAQIQRQEAFRALAARITDRIDREIALRRAMGQSHDQIALRLSISPDSVRKRWSRLLERFREDTP